MVKSKIVKLKLPSEALSAFSIEEVTPKKRRKSSSSNGSSSKQQESTTTTLITPTPIKHESNLNTPIPSSRAGTPSALEDGRRRARGGKSKGSKRSLLSSPAPSDTPLKQEGSTTSSTTVTTGSNGPNPTGIKSTLSKSTGTAGFNSLPNGENRLDKGGQPVRKWIKKPVDILSFTGYNIEFKSWSGESKEGEEKTIKSKVKDDGNEDENKEKEKDIEKENSMKIQIKLNNKKLDVDDASIAGGNESRDQSVALPDDASSIITSPEGSTAETPVS